MKTKKRNLKTVMLSLLLVGVMVISGISAYFTATDTATNTFTVGEVSIDLQEPNWPGEVSVVPNATTPKDPQILNDGSSDAYVYLEIEVPYANVVVAEADGARLAAADTELFSYTTNPGWIELGEAEKDDVSGVYRHVYAYASDANTLTVLTPDVTTATLFDEIVFANLVENQGFENNDLNVIINAYGIETEIIGGEATPEYVWEIINNQTIDGRPKMLEGNGQIYDASTALTLSFRSSAPLNEFEDIKVDGNVVEESNYTLTEGSTIVTFTNEYLATLSEGEHTVDIVSKKGTASGIFVIQNSSVISITDLSAYEQIVGLPNQTTAQANWVIKDTYKHIVVPVPEPGCTLTMTAGSTQVLYCGLKTYTVPTAASSPIEFSEHDDWNMRWNLREGTTVEKEIADDVKYILLVVLNNGVDSYPTSFEITNKEANTIFAFGDSITYGYYTTDDDIRHDVRYTEQIRKKLDCDIMNYGSSGAATGRLVTIVTGGEIDRKSDVDQSNPTLCTDYSNADVVTIMIGTNSGIKVSGVGSTFDDIPKLYGATVKTIADGGTIEYNGQTISTTEDYWNLFPNSFHGNLALCIEWITWKNPDAKIYLITPPVNNIGGFTPDNYMITEVRPAILEIGEYYGISVIDAQQNAGINIDNLYNYTYDGVHFNEEGCKIWGDYIANHVSF